MWFKKGELDAVAAQDPEGPGAANLLPIEDRYGDDGSVSNADTAAFGVRSGQTQSLDMLKQTRRVEVIEASGPPPEVIAHLKGGRLPVIAAIAASVLAMIAAVYVL